MVNFKLRRRKNDGSKKQESGYTLEYKLETVRLVQGGQACLVTGKVLGIPKQSLEN